MARAAISAANLSPLLALISWILLAWIVLTVGTRVVLRLISVRKLLADDYWVLISLGFAIAESITFYSQTQHGLGQHLSDLNDEMINKQLQFEYIGNLLYIPSLCFAKLASVWMLHALSRDVSYRRVSKAIGLLVILWSFSSMFVYAFPCPLPRPWDLVGEGCYNTAAVNEYFFSLNLITELTLVVFPCVIVIRLNLTARAKLAVLSTFLFRVSVLVAITTELVFQQKVKHTRDRTYDIWVAALCRQVIQFTCIIATCIVYLKPFLDSDQGGFIRFDDIRRRVQSSRATPAESSNTLRSKQHINHSEDNEYEQATNALELQAVPSHSGFDWNSNVVLTDKSSN